MKLFISLVGVLVFLESQVNGRITLIGSYSDDFADVDFPTDDREDCVDTGTCGGGGSAASALYAAAEKRMILPDKVVEHRQLVPRMQAINTADSFTHWKPVCGCTTEHELINFGEGHYPRYITTARCKTKTCSNKFYQCRYYDYRVHILVKRGLNSILKHTEELDIRDVEELTLPESLHANWQLFALSVPVACIAVEKS